MTTLWWKTLPIGYYALAVHDHDLNETQVDDTVIGYTTCRRTRTGFRTGATYAVPGADAAKVAREAHTPDVLAYLLPTDPDWFREEYGRFTGRCGVCNRALTDPKSKLRGIGPDCWRNSTGVAR